MTDERPLVPFDEDGIREFVVSPDDAFVSWDAEGVITEWSARSESLFGWSRDEVLGRSFATTVLAPGDRIVHALRMECLLHDGERPLVGKWFELTAQRKDSREVPVEMTVWIVSNHEHHSFNAFVRDLEKRSAIEDALRDRARLQKAVDAVSHVIILTDVAGVIVYTSPSARTVLGFEADDLRGHVVDELVHVEDRALFARTLDRALRTGAQLVRAHRILTSDGRHLWMETTTAVVRDAVSGEVTGVEIVSRDITSHKLTDVARKRATGDLARMIMDLRAAVGREQEAVEELRALNRMKSDLVSNVSHELRTPLMSISSYTELLTDPSVGLLSSEQRSMLEVVERNTNRLLVTIENLLAIGG
ncbi:MAG: PAS domain S-box protein, partial [Polyangiales bacterium]